MLVKMMRVNNLTYPATANWDQGLDLGFEEINSFLKKTWPPLGALIAAVKNGEILMASRYVWALWFISSM